MARDRTAIGYGLLRAGAVLACAAAGLQASPAHAGATLTARYAITVGGIGIGDGRWAVDIDQDRYSVQARGEFVGVWRMILGNTVSGATLGLVRRGRLVPTDYEANFGWDDRIQLVRMALRDGVVTELDIKPPLPASAERVPLTQAHLGGVIDPLTAALVQMPAPGDALSAKACQRTLPVFIGDHRFDLALSFKRFDQVRTERGYQGRSIVCAVAYEPIAGHEANDYRVSYLRQSHGIEMWLAPIGDTRVLAPIRISVPTLIGAAELTATRFEAAAAGR